MPITLTQLHEHATTQTQKHLGYLQNLYTQLGESLNEPHLYLEMLESQMDILFKTGFQTLVWRDLQALTYWLLEHPETEPKARLQDWIKRQEASLRQTQLQSPDWHPNPMRRFRDNRHREALGVLLPTLKSKIEELE